MSEVSLINAAGAPEAIGPYSHIAKIGGMYFCSGQIPLDPETMEIVEGGVEAQTRQVLDNISKLLEELKVEKTQVGKITIFLTDMADFPVVNPIYAEFFGDHKPARSTIAVAALPLGSLVEIECIIGE